MIVQHEMQELHYRSDREDKLTMPRDSTKQRAFDEQIWRGRAHDPWLKPKGYNSRRKEDSSPNPNLVERFLYDAYGKRSVLNAAWVATVDAYSFLHGFAGGKQDAVTGRVHFRNRDYDPNLMRWISRDPIGFEGSPWNLYEYVESNPLNQTDPNGLAWLKPWTWNWPWTPKPQKCPPKSMDQACADKCNSAGALTERERMFCIYACSVLTTWTCDHSTEKCLQSSGANTAQRMLCVKIWEIIC